MTGEIGHLTLLLAGALAALQALIPILVPHHTRGQSLVVACAKGQFYLLSISFFSLAWAFYSNDFTLHYVSTNSNTLLPWYYRLSAVWGGHEGSLLLWIYILSIWTAAVARYTTTLPALFRCRVLAVLGYISLGFIAFIALTSNPFLRQYPIPFDGHDLNPLLQDPGLVFHPPLLYTGYVGFAVAFAFVVAGLWQGQLDSLWLKRARPWTLAAWLALTLGIVLGSYWAYYELGWGGWWFWDPVENASLMPWLIGTALIHSLAASDRRGSFMIWTALLAILAFSLSLVGTFLVRSGVLTSVHAFASDPTRGIFILALLIAITLPALILLIMRITVLSREVSYELLSRDTGLLANNWLFSGACLIVLTGTLYPLIADVLGIGKISVGAPYFNRLIVPLAFICLALLGVMPLLRWQRDRLKRVRPLLIINLLFALGFTLTLQFVLIPDNNLMTLIAVFTAGLALAAVFIDAISTLSRQHGRLPRARMGMLLAHLGFIITALAITATGTYSDEQDLSIREGDTVHIANYNISLLGLRDEKGPNYEATRGLFRIGKKDDEQFFTVLSPAKRFYYSSPMPMTESARLITPTHDLYIALGEKIGTNNWAIRLQYKPFIIWIWLGGLIMAVGGLLSATDRSYRTRITAETNK